MTRRLPDARLLVAGDPAMPLDGLRERGASRMAARLSLATELDRALSEATVAVFPYRAELDQSGALLQALGAGVPAVVYDVAGLGEPVRASARARSCRPATSTRSPKQCARCSTTAMRSRAHVRARSVRAAS